MWIQSKQTKIKLVYTFFMYQNRAKCSRLYAEK